MSKGDNAEETRQARVWYRGKIGFVASVMLIAALVVSVLIAIRPHPLTREEAIEISKSTPIVQEALNKSNGTVNMDVAYLNASYIRSLEGKWPGDVYVKLPKDHGVWWIIWDITPPGYQIVHFIDELSGQVLHESWFVAG